MPSPRTYGAARRLFCGGTCLYPAPVLLSTVIVQRKACGLPLLTVGWSKLICEVSTYFRWTLGESLQGEAALPLHIALEVTVDSSPIVWPAVRMPWRGSDDRLPNYCLYVPGVLFNLYIGRMLKRY